jgi:hypothetical protein
VKAPSHGIERREKVALHIALKPVYLTNPNGGYRIPGIAKTTVHPDKGKL